MAMESNPHEPSPTGQRHGERWSETSASACPILVWRPHHLRHSRLCPANTPFDTKRRQRPPLQRVGRLATAGIRGNHSDMLSGLLCLPFLKTDRTLGKLAGQIRAAGGWRRAVRRSQIRSIEQDASCSASACHRPRLLMVLHRRRALRDVADGPIDSELSL